MNAWRVIGWLWLLSTPAVAQDAAESNEEAGGYEITVFGEQAVRAARDDVVREMEGIGWRAVRKKNGDVVFRGPEAWMGRAILDTGGDLSFTTPIVSWAGEREAGSGYDPRGLSDNDFSTPTYNAQFTLGASKRKAQAMRASIRAEVQPLVTAYQQAVRRFSFEQTLFSLTDRLDALWQDGRPLAGGEAVGPVLDRRAAILEFWAGRASTVEGYMVMDGVERWIRRVVQESPHPFTEAEVAAAEAQRDDGRQLAIFP